jgi:hypothetical protein
MHRVPVGPGLLIVAPPVECLRDCREIAVLSGARDRVDDVGERKDSDHAVKGRLHKSILTHYQGCAQLRIENRVLPQMIRSQGQRAQHDHELHVLPRYRGNSIAFQRPWRRVQPVEPKAPFVSVEIASFVEQLACIEADCSFQESSHVRRVRFLEIR